MSKPTLSIIVPVYNVEPYLDACVQSIVNQTFQDWELRLVNDGSTDGSWGICDRWASRDERITALHQENTGQAAARNAALGIAQGQFITFVDSDDEITSETYAENIEILLSQPEIELLCYPMTLDYNNQQRRKEPLKAGILQGKAIFLSWYNHLPINKSSCSKIYRTDVIRDLRYPEGHLHEDFWFHLKLIPRLNNVYISPKGNYHYYSRECSTLHTPKLQRDRDWVDAELEMLRQMYAYKEITFEYLPRYMSAARYMMNSTLKFPDADLTPQIEHLQQNLPPMRCLFKGRQRPLDCFWYIFIAMLGIRCFFKTYRRILHR